MNENNANAGMQSSDLGANKKISVGAEGFGLEVNEGAKIKLDALDLEITEETAGQLISALRMKRLRKARTGWAAAAIGFGSVMLMLFLSSDNILSWLAAKLTGASYDELLRWADSKTLGPGLFMATVGFVMYAMRNKKIAGCEPKMSFGRLQIHMMPTVILSFQAIMVAIFVVMKVSPIQVFNFMQGLACCAYGYFYPLQLNWIQGRLMAVEKEIAEIKEAMKIAKMEEIWGRADAMPRDMTPEEERDEREK